MNKELGYVRVGALIPELKVGNTVYNIQFITLKQLLKILKRWKRKE